MKKLIALMIAMVMIFGLASFAAAEEKFSPHGSDGKGQLGEDGHSWRLIHGTSSIIMEGDTSDGNETTLSFTNPTADRTVTFGDASGTVAYTESIGSTITLADTKLLIGQSTGLAAAQTMGLDATITNAGAVTVDQIDNNPVDFATVTDGFLQIATDADNGSWDAKAMSGDVTITNAGVATVIYNTVTLAVAASTGINTVTVESGSTFIGWRLITLGTVANTPTIDNTTATSWFINTNEASLGTRAIFKLTFSRP